MGTAKPELTLWCVWDGKRIARGFKFKNPTDVTRFVKQLGDFRRTNSGFNLFAHDQAIREFKAKNAPV